MKGWQRILRDNDPGTERMDADTAARMRDVVVAAASAAAPSRAEWPMRLALSAFACLVMMLSVFGTQPPREIASATALPVAGSERRQIQFATPGGTRIIWEINPNFSLGETLP
jgi:hypothetical protein